MPELDYDLQKVLTWCRDKGVTFKVSDEGGLLTISAECDNISADYAIEEPFGSLTLGNAMWAALFAVKHGTEFHQRLGFTPTPEQINRSEGPPQGVPVQPAEPPASISPSSLLPKD